MTGRWRVYRTHDDRIRQMTRREGSTVGGSKIPLAPCMSVFQNYLSVQNLQIDNTWNKRPSQFLCVVFSIYFSPTIRYSLPQIFITMTVYIHCFLLSVHLSFFSRALLVVSFVCLSMIFTFIYIVFNGWFSLSCWHRKRWHEVFTTCYKYFILYF